MDTVPISFTGKLTEQDVLDLVRYRSLCQVRPSIRWLIAVVSFLIAAGCVAVNVLIGFNPLLAFFLLGCAYFPVGWWYHALWAARRHYRKHPELYLENTFTVDADAVRITNADLDYKLVWKHIHFLLDTPKGLMFLLPNTQVLCWLPQRLFEGNNYKTSIFAFAAANNIQVRCIK